MNTLFTHNESASESTHAEAADGERASGPVPFRVVAFGAAVLDPHGPPPPGSKLRVRSGLRGGIVIGSVHLKRAIVIGS